MKEEVAVVEIIHAAEGKADKLKKALTELVPISRAAPGCLQYDLFGPLDGGNEFLILMRWKTLSDLRQHETSPYVEEFARKYDKVLYDNFTVTEWKKII